MFAVLVAASFSSFSQVAPPHSEVVVTHFYTSSQPFGGFSERASVLAVPNYEHSNIPIGNQITMGRSYEVDSPSTWVFEKLFNDDLIAFQGNDSNKQYFIAINPVLQVGGGLEFGSSNRTLFENGRGARVHGSIGSKFGFETTVIESQQITPTYLDSYIEERGVVPGQGIAKRFGDEGWDHRWASGNISYTPSQYFNFSLGQGRFFYGDGYRSLLLSDNALNYPYFRIETTVGPVKYINLWTQMYDIRPEVNLNPGNRKKWISSHYLSWNVNERLNLNFFEAVVSRSDTNNTGFDVSYLNPIIFYRPIEDQIDSRLGNAVLGMGASYDVYKGIKTYGQFVLDEFNISALRAGEGSWLNKFGFQLGARYDFQGHYYRYSNTEKPNIYGFSLIAEYNQVRPFTYTHSKTLTNYAHYSQPLAHPLGTDFKEFVFRAQAVWNRWLFTLHYSTAQRGLPEVINGEYQGQGADLWVWYRSRSRDEGFEAGGSPSAMINNFRFETFYEFNPYWRMGLFGTIGYRSGPMYPFVHDPSTPPNPTPVNGNWWLSFGVKTDLYRTYSDI